MACKHFSLFVLAIFLIFPSCSGQPGSHIPSQPEIIPGAERTGEYFPELHGKRLAVVANHTSLVGEVHLVDTLLSSRFHLVCIFSPEHGFRGEAGAGEQVHNRTDEQTGLPVVSLYGAKRRPGKKDLTGIDLLLFDMQDVGVRFYTYISTLSYVMEECAELGIPVIVLDRPNPHSGYIDGPILDKKYASFVGLHPVPVVYGMTIGEYALMVNGEGWLKNGLKATLSVIPVGNYSHSQIYTLPVKPSPNLPNMDAVYLYPSLCFFEGTIISIGRGTETPFQVIGHPDFTPGTISFTPRSLPGYAMKPKFMDTTCYGYRLVPARDGLSFEKKRIQLNRLIELYTFFSHSPDFFNSYFDILAGSPALRKQIIAGIKEEEIRLSWQKDIAGFREIRSKYLLYPDFE